MIKRNYYKITIVFLVCLIGLLIALIIEQWKPQSEQSNQTNLPEETSLPHNSNSNLEEIADEFPFILINIEEIKSETNIREVYTFVDGEKLLFEQYETEQGIFIRSIEQYNSPPIYTNEQGTHFLFTFNKQLYKYEEEAEAIQLTPTSYYDYKVEDFINTIGSYVFWAEVPNLNPNGLYVLYYTNRHIIESAPALRDSLRLINLETKEEASYDIINSGASLSPYTYWIDNRYFIYQELHLDNRTRLHKFDIETKTITNSIEFNGYNIIENGYLVYRRDKTIEVIHLDTWTEYSYELPEIGLEPYMTVSKSGSVIYPYKDSIVILNESFSLPQAVYKLPLEESLIENIEFIDDVTLLVQLNVKAESTSWLFKLD